MENKKTIYKCFIGSISHNLYIPASMDAEFGTCDKDIMEIFAYDKSYYLGLDGYHRKGDTKHWIKKDKDFVGHELRKAIALMAGGNPNMLVPLFTRKEHIVDVSKGGRLLLMNRELFLGADNIRKKFCGYAYSQLHRMTKHNFEGYMGDKRKAIVEKYGYDTKNAMTLIRLLDEGIELLQTGELTVYKEGKERDLLMDIKRAKLKLDVIKVMAERRFEKMKEAYSKTILPKKVDMKKIDKLLRNILEFDVFLGK